MVFCRTDRQSFAFAAAALATATAALDIARTTTHLTRALASATIIPSAHPRGLAASAATPAVGSAAAQRAAAVALVAAAALATAA